MRLKRETGLRDWIPDLEKKMEIVSNQIYKTWSQYCKRYSIKKTMFFDS